MLAAAVQTVHHMTESQAATGSWAALPYDEWRATRDTLHTYAQVIGKLRLSLSPFEPQWANVALYVTARGLSTSPLPAGAHAIDAELDLVGHELVLRSTDGAVLRRPLGGSVADFYADVHRLLRGLQVHVAISPLPQEISDPIPFQEDRTHHTYDREQAARFFQAISRVDLVMKEHRARFRGRTTPVHFFWGTFDLALTRYSGRPAPVRPEGGVIERFSGDAEAICVGWWPGGERHPAPAFFAYGYPAPLGVADLVVAPAVAAWDPDIGEFLLPYDAVRSDRDPRRATLDFFESTYRGLATLMEWDPELAHVHALRPHSAQSAPPSP